MDIILEIIYGMGFEIGVKLFVVKLVNWLCDNLKISMFNFVFKIC